MTTKEFERDLAKFIVKYKNFKDNRAKRIMGVTAVSCFKKNFQTESFFGARWKQVQRRIPGTPAYKYPKQGGDTKRRTRKILTGNKQLL